MTTPTDIITYVGVPLAVLGIMPVLYTSARVLYTVRKIRHELKKSGTPTATTRSGLMSGVVEVELPRYTLRPLPREDARYWTQTAIANPVKGGSWMALNWDPLAIGHVTYRLQYHDELQQPQSEVVLAELLEFLIDRGAVPSAEGFRILRALGLRAPVGTVLLTPPGQEQGRDYVLKISSPDGSEGHLSLSLMWKAEWANRDINSLPPWWMRIQGPPVKAEETEVEGVTAADTTKEEVKNEKKETVEATDKAEESKTVQEGNGDAEPKNASITDEKAVLKISEKSLEAGTRPSIRMHIGSQGVERVAKESETGMATENVDIYHLIIAEKEHSKSGQWFSAAATASADLKVLKYWTYTLPEELIELAKREVIPCGIMVNMSLMSDDEVPDWRTPVNHMKAHDRFSEQFFRRNALMNAERNMSPDQALASRLKREAEERHERMMDMRRETEERRQEYERLQVEILKSPRLSNKVVAMANLEWLRKQNKDYNLTMQTAVHILLYKVVFDPELAATIDKLIVEWRGWHETGGLHQRHISYIAENQLAFAYVSCILYLISEVSKASTISEDLRECIKSWATVRLG